MSWRSIAFNKTLRSARRYFGYLSSSSLAVMVFFMFALFVNNPYVENGYMTDLALKLLDACRVIVVLFAVFFIVYFHSSLLRMRQREFGLLLTLGMTPKQVGRMIFAESVGIGFVAIVVGIGFGIIFGKMFMLAMGNILSLDQPIPFAIPEQTIVSTVIIFGLLFFVEGFWVSRRMIKLTPKTLIGADRTRQTAPRFSILLVLVALACLGCGYYLAVFKSQNIGSTMAPILLFIGVGTYFLFTQLLGFVLGVLRKRPLEGTSLLIVSRLQHRMKDYARILAVVTLLTATVLSGMGSVFGTQQAGELNSIRVNPFALQVVTREATASAVAPEVVRDVFKQNHVTIGKEVQTPLLIGQVSGEGKKYAVWTISNSNFDKLVDTISEQQSRLEPYMKKAYAPGVGEARLYVPYPLVLQELFPGKQVQLQVEQQTIDLKLDGQHDTRVLNTKTGPDFVMVLPDDQFNSILDNVPTANRWMSYAYMSPDWADSQGAVTSLQTPVQSQLDQGQLFVTDTIVPYTEAMQMLGVMLFAGFFVSVLFFLASGSAIYFKLFAQQEEDIRQFKALRRMGFRSVEVKKILTIEFLLLFFAPFAVGLMHSTMAMINFRNLVTLDGIWSAFVVVVIASLVSFLLYFLVARLNYIRRVWQA